jgi:hypothetical protein
MYAIDRYALSLTIMWEVAVLFTVALEIRKIAMTLAISLWNTKRCMIGKLL